MRAAVIIAIAAAATAWGVLAPPVLQSQAYHRFADTRMLLAVANAADTLSNLVFLVVGVLGLAFLWRERAAGSRERFASPAEMRPYWVFFAGVALTSAGSAWYHLAPDDGTLLWDRLPMAVAFAALLTAVLAERVSARAARLLGPLAFSAVATVLYWWATERAGVGDLRPYAVAQFYPLVAVPLTVALFPERYTRGGGWIAAPLLYALAKWAELSDAAAFEATGLVSGHTLKHLLAAGAIAALAGMLWRRSPLPEAGRRGQDASRARPGAAC